MKYNAIIVVAKLCFARRRNGVFQLGREKKNLLALNAQRKLY